MARERTVSVSAYVDLPLAEVLARFAAPDIDDLLTACVHTALGDADEAGLRAHADPPVWQSAHNARVPVTWDDGGSSGQTHEGSALLSLLVVQSGHDAITELLLALPVSEERQSSATPALHRILDEITGRLEAAAT